MDQFSILPPDYFINNISALLLHCAHTHTPSFILQHPLTGLFLHIFSKKLYLQESPHSETW